MADQPVSPIKESVTTREEMDFDDDAHEQQETGTVSPLGHETPNKPATPSPMRKSVSFAEEEAPPAMPPRPLSPQQQAENTLIEAFPSIDTKVVKAVLNASGGKVEPAFNALLGMSDPDFQPEETPAPPPRQPPRPVQRQQKQQPMSQLEADEQYARQLAEQYNTTAPRGQIQYNQREPGRRNVNKQQTYDELEHGEHERNFFDDDLPEIGKNIQQGFLQTQKTVNSWITNFKKKIDGEDSDEEDLYSSSTAGNTRQNSGRQNFGSSQSEQLHGIRKVSEQQQRRSTEANRYDADPHVLDEDEFERLELHDAEAPPPQPPRTSSRQAPNPNLFKSTSAQPPQSGPVDEVDAADRKSSDGTPGKKWQPLTSVAPAPEEDNDPFSLSDDEESAEKGEDLRKEDSARLKEAARNSVQAGAGEDKGLTKQLTESGVSGTKNKEAEEMLEKKE